MEESLIKQPMMCPKCNIAMNRHAEKLVEPRDGDAAQDSGVLGGAIEEIHSCPGCGGVGARAGS